MSDISHLLEAIQHGNARAGEELLPLVYAELRQLARAKMAREQPGHTLQATALVHEAWMRLGEQRFESRAHFFGAAAEAMRRILIERARRKLATKHGGGSEHVGSDELDLAIVEGKEGEMLEVNEALDALAEVDRRKAELVKLHYFAGFTLAEAADILGVAEPTARRDWAFARAWLHRKI